MKAEEEVDPETEQKYMELIEKRASRIPLQQICESSGIRVDIPSTSILDVLIPRQDTETLVSEAAKTIQGTPRRKAVFFRKTERWQRVGRAGFVLRQWSRRCISGLC